MRSKGSLKPLIPCLDDPVNKLEGLGEKTRRNLLDVRMCAASQEIADAVPDECRNTVTTGCPPPFPPPHFYLLLLVLRLHSSWFCVVVSICIVHHAKKCTLWISYIATELKLLIVLCIAAHSNHSVQYGGIEQIPMSCMLLLLVSMSTTAHATA